MRNVFFVAIILLTAVTIAQATGLPPREENRLIIISEEGPDYDPERADRVVEGVPHALWEDQLTFDSALEVDLDWLEVHDIVLSELPVSSSSSEPDWPLVGHFYIRSVGYYEEGARCSEPWPTYPEEVQNIINQMPGENDRLGTWEGTASEFPTNDRGTTAKSFLIYWELTADPATDEPTGEWVYDSWTLNATGYMDYECHEPTGGKGRTVENVYVTGVVDRTDEDEG